MAINYIKQFEDGTTVATATQPSWGIYEKTSADDNRDVYIGGKWHPTSSGGELVTNGTFDTDTSGWISVNSYLVSLESNTIKINRNGGNDVGVYTAVITEIGKKYRVKATSMYQNYDAKVGVGITPTGMEIYFKTLSSTGIWDFEFIALAQTTYITLSAVGNTAGIANFDNISLYAVEPTLGEPYTEQFTYASKDGKLLGVEVADGQPVDIHYDEYAPTLVEDTIKATNIISDNYVGKNACTAWVNFDGTTTPPTIRDSFNVSDVVRVASGRYGIYIEDIDNLNYSVNATNSGPATGGDTAQELSGSRSGNYVEIHNPALTTTRDTPNVNVQIFGGKN